MQSWALKDKGTCASHLTQGLDDTESVNVLKNYQYSQWCGHGIDSQYLTQVMLCLRKKQNTYWYLYVEVFICLVGSWMSPRAPAAHCAGKTFHPGASLVVQWLRICLPMQGTRVRALVWENPTYRGATRPVSHNYWACASGACAPQRERPRWWEARAPRWGVAPACHN